MKGVVLAGGHATRLRPCTYVTNKHLLPVYDKPMIYYPLKTLADMGIWDIMLISGRGHAGHFLDLLGSGKELGVDLTYDYQEEAGGIAQALGIAEEFVDGEKCVVILGDNIFEDSFLDAAKEFEKQPRGAHVFVKEVPDPQRFGVPEIVDGKVRSIIEKPKEPKSRYAVTGLYMYDPEVFHFIHRLKPSGRGELEITDVNNAYIATGTMTYTVVQGYWTDAGTFPSLLRANMLAAQKGGLNLHSLGIDDL
jgi:glucose-1-phosphate thymidylyltransferase